jgi:RNA polymerase sigma factor (sigma-70 family)
MQGDAQLLRLYAGERSEAAFAELVRRHVNLVYSAALRQLGGDAHAAEDVTQAVFTDLARKAEVVAGREVIASWLYTSTRYTATNVRRARGRRIKHETEAELMRAIESPSATEWERLRPLVDDVMHELNERDRGAVVLRFFEGRPFAEIGEACGLTEDAARMRVERALEKLRALLARRGVTSTSAALSVALMSHSAVAAPAGLAASVTGAALAGAAAGGAAMSGVAAVGAVTFMSMAKITVAGLVVAGGLAGIGFGLYSSRQAEAASERVAGMAREADAWQAKVKASEARAEQAETRARESEARATSVRTASAAKPVTNGQAPAASEVANAKMKIEATKAKLDVLVAEKMTLMTNPELQRTRLEVDRLGMGLRFSQLYRNLNLTPDQIARFEARWVESRQEGADILAAARANGIAPDDPALRTLANQGKEKFENDMRAILGEAGYADFQRYERTYGAREMVTAMQGNLAFSDAPLTREQVNRLTQIIADQRTEKN